MVPPTPLPSQRSEISSKETLRQKLRWRRLTMALIGGMVIVSLQIGTSSRAIDPAPHMAMPAHPTQPSSQFQTIEQPFWVKAIVTVGGLSLIGLELWWFLYKPSTTKNTP